MTGSWRWVKLDVDAAIITRLHTNDPYSVDPRLVLPVLPPLHLTTKVVILLSRGEHGGPVPEEPTLSLGLEGTERRLFLHPSQYSLCSVFDRLASLHSTGLFSAFPAVRVVFTYGSQRKLESQYLYCHRPWSRVSLVQVDSFEGLPESTAARITKRSCSSTALTSFPSAGGEWRSEYGWAQTSLTL